MIIQLNNLRSFQISDVLAVVLIILLMVLTACDRLNMYDIASGKSKTAYALACDGTNCSLILANVEYVKTFSITPAFSSTPAGISVSEKGKVIVFDTNYTYRLSNDLNTYSYINSAPPDSDVHGGSNYFNCISQSASDNNYIYTLSTDNLSWQQFHGPFGQINGNQLRLFKGINKEIYFVELIGSTTGNIYSVNDQLTLLFTKTNLLSGTIGHLLGGYKTNNYFYIWGNYPNNSIIRFTPTTSVILNPTSIGNFLVDVTVTDNDKVFAIVFESGSYYLKEIISDNNYPVLLNLGSIGNFNIDSLDNNHLIIASSNAEAAYNGLLIYNIEENKIEKHITSTNVVAMYVLR